VNLPRVKSAIRSLHRRDAVQLLDSVLHLESSEQVIDQISITMEELGLRQLLQPSLSS